MRISRRGAPGGGLGVIVVVLVARYLGVERDVILQSLPPGDTSPASGEPYRPSGAVQSACGLTGSAVGHHVQTLLGISRKVRDLQQRADRARQILEQGDIEEGLTGASAIGDDRIQKRTQGYVVPDAFTYGSSAERVRWLQRGLKSGDPDQCGTFGSRSL